tara:strand:- start:259 stop:399 length:141 start_codon:yes stop_codon:yes gene_type:complete
MREINAFSVESKNDIADQNFLIPILEEIEQSLIDIKIRLDKLENPI